LNGTVLFEGLTPLTGIVLVDQPNAFEWFCASGGDAIGID